MQMKIQGQNKQMLAAACQMFMGKSEPEIAQIALETLEGHQRAIIAHLTVEVRLRRVGRLLYHTAVDCSVLMKPSVCDARPSLTGNLQGQEEVLGAGIQGGLFRPGQHGHRRGQLHSEGRPRRAGQPTHVLKIALY